MAVPSRSRLVDLMKVQCRIFNTIFNPQGLRLGNKVLRQRLRGATIASYYPPRIATFKRFRLLYPDFDTYDGYEEDRLDHVSLMKSRGKGVPKKKRSASESSKTKKKK